MFVAARFDLQAYLIQKGTYSLNSEDNPDDLKEKGLSLVKEGQLDEALACFEAAAEAYAADSNEAGQAEMHNNIGVIYRMQRNWNTAEESLLQAESGFRALGDNLRRAQVLGNLGDVYASKHENTTAARYYSDASEQFAKVGDGEQQYRVLRTFSIMRIRQRHWPGAIDLMARALEARPRRSFVQQLFYPLLRLARRLWTSP
jgi:tetratricopeptide (TPR) repeat protein